MSASPSDTGSLPAGEFAEWLRQTRAAQAQKRTVGVACGSCIGCCTSSYFIHIAPDETETLQRIPKALKFAAPVLPKGHVLMGYDEQGRCPMLAGGKCSIYEHRPQTCRNYDCRVFPAAGIEAGGAEKELINQRVRRWKFSYPTEQDHSDHVAVMAAARFLREKAELFPVGFVPGNAAQLAILAIKVYEVFKDDAGQKRPNTEIVSDVMAKIAG